MTTEKELLQEILAAPDTDEPRLVYADWLQEQGDPRGEFIQLQCQCDPVDWDDPRCIDWDDAVDQLLKKHRTRWLKSLPKLSGIAWGAHSDTISGSIWDNTRTYFVRGFAEIATIKNPATLRKQKSALREYGLARYLSLLQHDPKMLAMLGTIESIRGLDIAQASSPMDWTWLEKSAFRERLQCLSLEECDLQNSGLEALLSIDLPSLTRLNLSFNSLQFPCDALQEWEGLSKLGFLSLRLNDLAGAFHRDQQWHDDTEGLRGLLQTPGLSRLHALDLSCNRLSAVHAELIAKQGKLPRLTQLAMSRNDLEDEGLAQLATAKLGALRELGLSRTGIGPSGVNALLEAPWAKTLRRLNFGGNAIADAGVIALAENGPPRLTHLDLWGTGFGEQGAAALIESTRLVEIRHLNIGVAELKPATIKALQKRYPRAIAKKPYGS